MLQLLPILRFARIAVIMEPGTVSAPYGIQGRVVKKMSMTLPTASVNRRLIRLLAAAAATAAAVTAVAVTAGCPVRPVTMLVAGKARAERDCRCPSRR